MGDEEVVRLELAWILEWYSVQVGEVGVHSRRKTFFAVEELVLDQYLLQFSDVEQVPFLGVVGVVELLHQQQQRLLEV